MSLLVSSLSAASATAASAGATMPSPQESLGTALTLEGLLFAGFSLSVRFTEPSTHGRSRFYAQGWFGVLFVLTIAAAAAAAGAAWWSAYQPNSGHSLGEWVRMIGLVPGIVAPPLFAAVINWEVTRSE